MSLVGLGVRLFSGGLSSARLPRAVHADATRSSSACSPPSATCASRRSSPSLDGFDAVILDDIGYVQQNRDEMEVLFTFLAERYERRSVIITSNLVFSEWDRIFKDPMTTAAAIDRLVHHSVILEMTGTSVRAETAEQARKEGTTTTTATTTTKPKQSTRETHAQM